MPNSLGVLPTDKIDVPIAVTTTSSQTTSTPCIRTPFVDIPVQGNTGVLMPPALELHQIIPTSCTYSSTDLTATNKTGAVFKCPGYELWMRGVMDSSNVGRVTMLEFQLQDGSGFVYSRSGSQKKAAPAGITSTSQLTLAIMQDTWDAGTSGGQTNASVVSCQSIRMRSEGPLADLDPVFLERNDVFLPDDEHHVEDRHAEHHLHRFHNQSDRTLRTS